MIDDDLVRVAADAIMRYLHSHPHSADTVEGIHEWWIDWPSMPESLTITHIALVRLEAAGLLECRRVSNREVWRLRQSQSD
ncbi:hypothetical protein [Trinickia dinghuensis]|uniref:Uncharacterized protein n=1 Tax=Trinickia dinghuensis TaxID=2291023 RepID=A0A3D8JQL0_9BURK|nr:hypothetical protein [Trinickia dinghuensis]RDU94721.1 hypothetical protein DWV00_32475 [Trinickia dinghuensis]